MRVVITRSARSDLRGIFRHSAADNLKAARSLLDDLDHGCTVLIRDNPLMGSARDEIAPGLRVLVVRGYLICYRPSQEVVRILRVFHGSLDITRQF